jgi:outer membrane protein OmpA-like peptidoglycan-associated protein/ABC-type nitrate/sulfonate/bicarbonate transport system substrate-binding protein
VAQVKLTAFSKALIALVILSVFAAAAWFLGVKDLVMGGGDDATTEGGGLLSGMLSGKPKGPLGTPGNPIKMSIVSFTGYAPALHANGNSLRTQEGSIFAGLGADVEFLLQDDIPTLAQNFGSGVAHCSWRTVDFWAQEHPGLKASGFDAKMVAIVDNTRGADAIVARAGINSVEELAGKKVALVQFTPSHWMLDYAIENSSMSKREKQALRESLVFMGDLAEVRSLLKSGGIDAAVLWDPDSSMAIRDIEGASVIFSTATASNLVFDGIVCNQAVIDEHPEAVQKLVEGWLAGVAKANADKSLATDALIATEAFFEDLAKSDGKDFINGLYTGIKWTNLSDNVRILGLGGASGDAMRVYRQAGEVWRVNGGIADLSVPPIAPSQAFDVRFVEALLKKAPEAKEAASKPEFTFKAEERIEAAAAKPVLTKPVAIYFDSGKAALDVNAKKILDDQVVPLIENVGSAYISVEGNTDKTGNRNANTRLSHERANAVTDYLIAEWDFDKERFEIRGNGPDKPSCKEDTPDCYERNRRTDIAVYRR